MRLRSQDTPDHRQERTARVSLKQSLERPDRRVFLVRGATLLVATFLSGCGGGGGSSEGIQQTVAPPTPTPTPPVILTNPESQTLLPGQSATFRVDAVGEAPLSYQWLRGDTDIPGATGQSYTTPPVSRADDGASFSVVVSSPSGSVTSRTVQLTVNLIVIFVDSKAITIDSTQITADAG